MELYIIKDRGNWKVNDSQLEALLSLVSYSVWAAEQSKRKQETDKGKSPARSESSRHLTTEPSVKDNRSIGWLRAKAPDSRIYDQVVDKSSPKLASDLRWWIPDAELVLKEARTIHTCTATKVLADSPNSLSDSEAKCDRLEPPALGFYVDDETSGENGMFAIQRILWRALTCSDTFCSWECKERQVFIFHLFSTFIWATAPYLSASNLRPRAVTFPHELGGDSRLSSAHLKSDKIENIVQELQNIELGAPEEIYKVLIPPLSHFHILPNEVLADCWNESLIEQVVSLRWEDTFRGYLDLLYEVQIRKAQDRFANRAAAMLVEFCLRVNERPRSFLQKDESYFSSFYAELEESRRDETLLKAILSLKDILARRWDLPKDDRARLIVRKFEFDNFLVSDQFHHLPLDELCSSDDKIKDDFSFPNNTDVFGWTKEYWEMFKGTLRSEDGFNTYKTVDVAGQSVLHHKIDSIRHSDSSEVGIISSFRRALPTIGEQKLLEDSKLFTTRFNKQTLLHRAARVDYLGVTVRLLDRGADPNARDHLGRTALCLAAYHGHSELVRKLYDRMDLNGRNQKDGNGRNALHYAVLNRQEKAALDLIDLGIDINAEDHKGGSSLWYAAWDDMKRVVECLLERKEINLDILSRERWESPKSVLYPAEHDCQKGIAKMVDCIKERKNEQVGLKKWGIGRNDIVNLAELIKEREKERTERKELEEERVEQEELEKELVEQEELERREEIYLDAVQAIEALFAMEATDN